MQSWGYCRFQLDPNCPLLPNNEQNQRLQANLNEVYNKLDSVSSEFKEALQYIWHYPPFVVRDIFEELEVDEEDADPYKEANLFCVVRNPYDRVVSQYYYREGFFRTIDELNSVDYMNNRIQKHMIMAKKNYLYSNGHYIPQYDYVYDSMNGNEIHQSHNTLKQKERIVKHILRYEHLEEDFDSLMKYYNLPVRLHSDAEKSNRPRKRKSSAKLSKLSINAENRKLIEDYYQKDFEEFGYSKL